MTSRGMEHARKNERNPASQQEKMKGRKKESRNDIKRYERMQERMKEIQLASKRK